MLSGSNSPTTQAIDRSSILLTSTLLSGINMIKRIKNQESDKQPKYYTFTQNNSGGRFRGPAHYVIIKATSAKQANSIAEENGLYFDGCDTGQDCNCCGDRWYRAYSEKDATDVPMIYGEPAENFKDYFTKEEADILIIE